MKVLLASKYSDLTEKLKVKLNAHNRLEVIASHSNLTSVVDSLESTQIDVIVLGEELSGTSSLNAIIEILKTKPVPIIIVGYSHKIQTEFPDLLNLAFVDHVEIGKPEMINNRLDFSNVSITNLVASRTFISGNIDVSKYNIVIDSMSKKVSVKRTRAAIEESRQKAKIFREKKLPKQPVETKYKSKRYKDVIVIGASTGGPKMVSYIISQFPADFPPVFVVQHISKGFVHAYAERINENARINVKRADDGDLVLPGNVYIAPGGYHMEMIKGDDQKIRISITDGPRVNFVKPAVDVTLLSAIRVYGGNIVAAILTGMGSDGKEGCRVLKKFDGQVIALNKEDSVVYSMNKSVIEAGFADAVVGMDRIASELGTRIGYKMK